MSPRTPSNRRVSNRRGAGMSSLRFPGRLPLPRPLFTRSLRFRLTLSYVIFFAILLSALGLVFRQTLAAILDQQSRVILEEVWAAINGYLRFERRKPVWYYDRRDPAESAIVDRLQRHYLLTDSEGGVLEASNSYRFLGIDSPETVRAALQLGRASWSVRRNPSGAPFLVLAGAVHDDRRRPYYLAIALPLDQNEGTLRDFTWNYFAVLPLAILASSLLGWFMAKRALWPLEEVTAAAQRISGSNLDVRIPPRESGDELDRLVRTFNHMMDRLGASFEQIRRFSTDVSHELRTPLTAARGQIEVALLTARREEEYREAMANALEDLERLSRIVRALLLLSEAESGQLALQRTRFDLGAAVRALVEEYQIPAEATGLGLRIHCPAERLEIEADQIQIERLVTNLLSNAIKYTPAGGEVRVRLGWEDGWVRLDVEDTGQGIPASALPYIFDRFYRVNPGSGNPARGLGLGLSFVSWIAAAHGGTVGVTSDVGKGSVFTVRLPASPAAAAGQTRAEAVPNASREPGA